MMVSRKSDDYEPIAWVRGYPVYVTVLLVGLHLLALAAWALVFAFHRGDWLYLFAFSSVDVLQHGRVWQWVTYAWVHEPNGLLGFAIEMFLLYAFGREVERYLGRRSFLCLYAWLVIAPPVLLTLAGFSAPRLLAGSDPVHFAVFLAFATLYPGVEFFFRIQARWIAWILLAIYTLGYLAANDWTRLGVLWVDAVVAFVFIGWLRGSLPHFHLPRLRPLRVRRRKGRPGGVRPETHAHRPSLPDDPVAAIDPLLEKISRQGIASLTDSEREQLEAAREALLSKGRR